MSVATFFGRIGRLLGAAVSGFASSKATMRSATQLPLSLREPLERTNHRGETVSLLEGPVMAIAATSAAMGAANEKRLAGAVAIAGFTAGAVGLYDDVVGARPEQKADKGFRGHLTALKEGRVSAGLVKIAGIGLAGVAAGFLLHPRKPMDALLAGGLIAGTANLLNLFDLRPGRAIKAGFVLGAPLLPGAGGAVVASTLGAAAGVLADDLQEKTMLGDAGANALGALLGVSMARQLSRGGKIAVLAGVAALTLASEKVSFTKVIENTPGLREIDMLGRRPAAAK